MTRTETIQGVTYEASLISTRTDGAQVWSLSPIGARGKALTSHRPALLTADGSWSLRPYVR